ncbi:MAG: PBECR4 domain-containing protein [Christensenellaceae bacterium]
MEKVPFEQRVAETAITEAANYKSIFVDWEYLICAEAFKNRDYYIIAAKEDNYQHLLGVNSKIPPQKFFEKCIEKSLNTEDFNFSKKSMSEKDVKGSVRRKIKALPLMMKLLNANMLVEENFLKNNISCSFASSDNSITVGFATADVSRPMTLLSKNELDTNKSSCVSLILRRRPGESKFNQIVVGSEAAFVMNYERIKALLGQELLVAMK